MMIDDKVSRWVRPEIQAINAYHVPNPGNLIKLDAMENPYHWPEAMVEQWLELLRETHVNRYPDPVARELTEALRHSMAIPEGMSLLLGNGSDEIIQILAMALGGEGRTVVAPEPGFVMYRMIATFCGMHYVGVPLQQGFTLDLPAMLAAIEQHDPAVIYLAYPNNPTGNLFDEDAMEQIIRAANGLVVVDEAYHAFAGKSFIPRLGEF
ncbi:MAG: aminotransferase class I/II-fold pyridoxal phosphate-dependent enzyme, partial [Gammaproteobacteria bacterium]|nr:aminotransferase class I/II-fold pyridoxal phosphate-dependent enzyme [Gammaproteobacteria bacterium]